MAALVAAACAGPRAGETDPAGEADAPSALPFPVAVSVPPQAWLVERIGGERVSVEVLVPPGTAPDSYDPPPRRIFALGRARLYVRVGHPDFLFERRFLDGLSARHPGLEVVDMSAGVDLLPGGHEHDEHPGAAAGEAVDGETDPHVWLGPSVMRKAAIAVAAALSRLDPEGLPRYETGLAELLADVDALDGELRTAFAGLAHRRFLVQHPAWAYLANEYGLEQVAIEHGGKEPGPAGLVALVEAARREGIRVVFVQRGFSDKAARAVARELDARVVEVDPLAHDWIAGLRRFAVALQEAAEPGEEAADGP